MIKFYREIRRKLLADKAGIPKDRFSKYLIYAIGEIVLVVIGILIALQINNWNENQKDRASGANYLNRISSDLKKDTTILNQKIHLAGQESESYLALIREMYNIQENKEDYIQLLNSVELNVDELILTDIAYNELLNTGKLDLIFNDNLKDQITEYYRLYDFVSSRVTELNASNLELMLASEVATPKLKYTLPGYMDIFPDNTFPEDEYMYNNSDWSFINIPESKEFRLYENAIYYYYLKQVLLKPLYNNLYLKAEELIDSIGKD